MKLVMAKEGYRKVGDKWLIAKKCTCCGRWLVASTVNYYKNDTGRYKLEGKCKECKKSYDKKWQKVNKSRKAETNKQYYQDNKKKILEINKQWREANPEYQKQYRENNKEKIAEYQKRYCEANKEKIAEQRKQYRENNKEKIAERNKQYREANKEKISEQRKQYRKNNKEKIAEINKQWREANPEYYKQYYQTLQGQIVAFNSRQKRRAKEEQQGDGITKDQWLELMSFFDWKCAYSGETLSKDNRSIDHIVPLNSGGNNMVWNCVPMLRSLNSSKNSKNMEEWYKEQDCYDPKRLAKIYEWKEYAYNKWGKNTEYFNSGNIQIKLI